jgi:hypothetical protein
MKRGSVRIQQTAFYTTMIVAYARPFAIGRQVATFPHRLLQYGAKEKELHEHLLELRNKEYAHSDPERTKVRPRQGEIQDMFSIRDVRLSVKQIDRFLTMTGALQQRISNRIDDIRAEAKQ